MARKNNSVAQDLIEVNGKLDKITSQINSAKNALMINNTIKYEEQLSKAVLSMEKQCLKMRELANYSLKLNNMGHKYLKLCDDISEISHQISVENCGDFFKITMPATLPRYDIVNSAGMSKYIARPLYDALRKYNKDHKIEKYKSAVMVVANLVDSEMYEGSIRDNDNYEYKGIVNNIAFWFLPDDGFKYCNMFTTTKLSDRSRTEIYVVPTEKFGDFYAQHLTEIMQFFTLKKGMVFNVENIIPFLVLSLCTKNH